MSIGRNEVLHVARLAELAVGEGELDRLVDQMNRIVDYVAQLDQVPADRMADAVPARTGVRRASRGRSGPGAARPPAGGVRARVPRRLLPGAAPWCHGGGVSGAATAAKETGARLAAAEPLNATLHWSQALLDAEAARVDACAITGSAGRDADRAQGQHRHRRAAHDLRLPDPGRLRIALQRHRGEPLARGRGDDRGARPTWTSSRWARPPSTRRSGG